MPFVSEKQRAWMYANKPEMAQKWEDHTPDNANLLERVSKKDAYDRAIKRMEK